MKVLFLDCFSGISGDMTVGALCDLGVSPSAFEWELSKVDIGDFHMHFERKQRQAIEGVKFGVHEGATHGEEHEHEHGHGHGHEHGHEHGHGHHHEEQCCCHGHHHEEHSHAHGRTFSEIRSLIEQSDLSDFVKLHAVSIFKRVAIAEGKIHGKPPEEVGFHEVGALDSIADIICACVGIEALGVAQVLVSPLHDGRGWVDCAHGQYPIPCTATLEILKGIPVAQVDEPFELITPTGAAIVAEFGQSFGLMPRIRVEKIGYGVGSRKLENRPNVLRAVLGDVETLTATEYQRDTISRIETNLDDLSPEIVGAVLGKLMDAGALDAFLTPIQMKKNRPAVQLTVLCEEQLLSKIADLIFAETTSFGVRMDRVERWKLDRKFENVSTPFGEITVKVGLRGSEPIQIAPEFESCRAASERTGQPLRAVYEIAVRSYWELHG
ncbi:MAG: nickel pincer cofactor biosynthesis protein LarC [Verrucomicrobiota bacterium]